MKAMTYLALAALLLADGVAAHPRHIDFSTPGWYVMVELLDEYGGVDYADLEEGPFADEASCEAQMDAPEQDVRRHCEYRDKGMDD